MRDFKAFKAECKKQMVLRDWTNADLAKATGYKIGTIESFMGNRKVTDQTAKAIAKALDIPEHMAT